MDRGMRWDGMATCGQEMTQWQVASFGVPLSGWNTTEPPVCAIIMPSPVGGPADRTTPAQ